MVPFFDFNPSLRLNQGLKGIHWDPFFGFGWVGPLVYRQTQICLGPLGVGGPASRQARGQRLGLFV